MGRPSLGDRVQLSMRLPVELHRRLADEAAARDVPTNYLVTRLLEESLERLIPVEELTLTRD